MTKTVRLTLDQDLTAKLEELADFHGESTEETLRLLIRYGHADKQRFAEEEFGQNDEKMPPLELQPDNEIPM